MRPALRTTIAFVGVSIAATAVAQSLDAPMRRPGLWDQTMTMPGGAGRTMTMKYCTDTATEKRFSALSATMRGQTCSKTEIHRTPAGVAFESVCTSDGATRTTSGLATGDFQSHFHVDVVAHSTAAGPRGGESHITEDGTWLGPCPAGMKPGDMVMPNGMTMNVNGMAR